MTLPSRSTSRYESPSEIRRTAEHRRKYARPGALAEAFGDDRCSCGIPDTPNELPPRDPYCPVHGTVRSTP